VRRVAFAALALVGAGARAEDSRDPSEGAPAALLAPVAVEGAAFSPDGAEVTVDGSRRSALLVASFRVDGPPGAHALVVDGPKTALAARWDGAPLALERTGEPCAPVEKSAAVGLRSLSSEASRVPTGVGIDPSSGKRYPIAEAAAEACERRRGVVEIAPGGRGRLELEHTLSAGFDRTRRRRTFPEVGHLLARRADYFVYHFAARGPGGTVALHLPPRTDGTWRWDGAVLRVSASETRHLPLGATVAVGGAGDRTGARFAARGTLEALLPWGDTVAVGVDGDVSDRASRLSASLGYQYFTRWISFFPVAAHLETGAVVDLWPEPRAGLRVGGATHFFFTSTQLLLDLFPDDGVRPWWRLTVVLGASF
jgi:hypothetical protein